MVLVFVDATLLRKCDVLVSWQRPFDPSVQATRKASFPAPFSRADDGDRTRDPQLGKLMLYQLSYVRAAEV